MAVEFETIKSEEIKFGRNSFIEVARKVAKPEDGEANEFVNISRGFYLPDGTKRFSRRKNISLPNDKDVLDKVAEFLKSV
ncbi:hypothetical protein GF374_00920 [Candidatus Woesearchaeota archaeon]|nr:hypothetical protein [Candidatus Woesearchaeota archaeon]